MNRIKSQTISFTGHRNYGAHADERLAAAIDAMYARGYSIFMSGMAVGFDLAAAERVLALRAEHPDVELLCAVPFRGQASMFAAADRQRYERVIAAATYVEFVAERYSVDCYARRNDFLVDNAAAIIAYFDGSSGGTQYTVRRARRLGLEVINLYDDPQLKIPGL